jgi:hypothetical protein
MLPLLSGVARRAGESARGAADSDRPPGLVLTVIAAVQLQLNSHDLLFKVAA